jgi:hypothetical protein
MLSKSDLYSDFRTSVFASESWYGDGPPLLADTFNAWATNFRRCETISLLRRDAGQAFRRSDDLLGRQFEELADRVSHCKPHQRCGSLGCLKCLRAAQKAKATVSMACIREIHRRQTTSKKLVMVTCIPTWMRYRPTDLPDVILADCNTWLTGRLKKEGFSRPMLGSIDISWEKGFYQVHWHFATWTSNPPELTRRLKAIFPSDERYDRPVCVKRTKNLDFLPYIHKCIKSVDLLRRNRRSLSHLLLMLDRTNPIDVMMLYGLCARYRDGKLVIEQTA